MTLIITIDRTSLTLADLVLSGTEDANPIGVQDYTPPRKQRRTTYAPDSPDVHGQIPLASSYQGAILGFEAFPNATDEATADGLLADLTEAVEQSWPYLVTVEVSNGPAKTYTCEPGSVLEPPRTYVDIRDSNPVWSVTIPCHPIPQEA